jgi:uncharacterized membrane-anchored protein YitT (DUF2179 family)
LSEQGEPRAGAARHALYEDILAILTAALLVAVGVHLYAEARLVTGGTAGLALLIHHATGAGFWLVFLAINLPFYLLAAIRMGTGFAIRTCLAVGLVALLVALTPGWLRFAHIDPLFAAIFGGGLMGTGLLILFRHRTALGSVNIVAMVLQERWGIRAGLFQLALDIAIALGAVFVLDTENLILSLAGAGMVNLTLAINHRPGRYMGMS